MKNSQEKEDGQIWQKILLNIKKNGNIKNVKILFKNLKNLIYFLSIIFLILPTNILAQEINNEGIFY